MTMRLREKWAASTHVMGLIVGCISWLVLGLVHGIGVLVQLRLLAVVLLISMVGYGLLSLCRFERKQYPRDVLVSLSFLVGSAGVVVGSSILSSFFRGNALLVALGITFVVAPVCVFWGATARARSFRRPSSVKNAEQIGLRCVAFSAVALALPLAAANRFGTALVMVAAAFLSLLICGTRSAMCHLLWAGAMLSVGMAAWPALIALRYSLNAPTMFTLQSLDHDWWIAQAWSLVQFGPWEDPLKPGYSLGYHFGAQIWTGVVASLAGVRAGNVAGVYSLLPFGLASVTILRTIIMRLSGGTLLAATLIASGLLFGAFSPLEANSAMFAESNTQYVSWAFLILALFIIVEVETFESRTLWALVVLSLIATYLTKITTAISALQILGSFIVFKSRLSLASRSLLAAAAVVSLVAIGVLHWVFFVFRNDGFFGRVVFAWPSLDYLWSYIGGPEWTNDIVRVALLLFGASTLVALVLVAFVSNWRLRSELAAIAALGGASAGLSIFLQFPPEGSGEKYILTNGVIAVLLVALCSTRDVMKFVHARPRLVVIQILGAMFVGVIWWWGRTASWKHGGVFPLSILLLFLVLGWSTVVNITSLHSPGRTRLSLAIQNVATTLPVAVIFTILGFAISYAMKPLVSSPSAHISSFLRPETGFGERSLRLDAQFWGEFRRQLPKDAVVFSSPDLQLDVVAVGERRVFLFEPLVTKYEAGSEMRNELEERLLLQNAVVAGRCDELGDGLRDDGSYFVFQEIVDSNSAVCGTGRVIRSEVTGRLYRVAVLDVGSAL